MIQKYFIRKGSAMEMIQTFQGYFLEDGHFVSDNTKVKLPTLKRTIINVLNDEITTFYNEIHDKQASAVIKFLEDIDALKDEDNIMTDNDWDELANTRNKTNGGLSRYVEL